jgi:uncharacterized protein YhaN
LNPVLDRAESRLRAIDQSTRRRLALEEDVAELEDLQRQLDPEVARAEAALASWSSEWVTLMKELGRRENASPAEVSDYLEAISDGLSIEAREAESAGVDFDDDRSRVTLDALADFWAKIQVILFTHHERVVQEARGLKDATSQVFVHELG